MDIQHYTQKNEKIGVLCLYAGKIMLESGAETYRVEDTMVRIASSYGIKISESYVTPTAILFSIEGASLTKTKMKRINKRTTNLNKIARVNSISREISKGNVSIEEAFQLLKDVEKSTFTYSNWVQVIFAAIASACFVIMFKGSFYDFMPALLSGGIGYASFLLMDRFTNVRFISEFTASFMIAIVALLSVHFGFGIESDKIIIGSVMPLVPGLLITNAIRDLLAGHLVSGLAKGVEALITAFAIGSGVAVVFLFF